MAVLIYLLDNSDKITIFKVSKDSIKQLPDDEAAVVPKDLVLLLNINGFYLDYLLKNLENYRYFRKLLRRKLHPSRSLIVKLVPVDKEPIDKKWSQMTLKTLWEAIEIDHLMSWLSTLGGGFSSLADSLGNQCTKTAETAGKISMKQLSLGLQIGDPFLQSRCKLYYSISLIQTGRLRTAKKIVREEYKFAKKYKDDDPRLSKMCEGIWLKLLYEYWLKKGQHENEMPKICFEQIPGK